MIDGTSGNDTLLGGLVEDDFLIRGGAGNDQLTGSNRANFSVYLGRFSDYTITTSAGVITVTDKYPVISAGTGREVSDGIDTLRGMNLLRFADRDFFVTAAANKVTLPGADQVYKVSNNAWILGNTVATETFIVRPKASALIAVGAGDVVELSGTASSYTYKSVLNQLQISDGTYTTFLNVGGKFTLRTASGSTSVEYTGNILLGGTQTVGSANFSAVAAITDTSRVSSIQLMPSSVAPTVTASQSTSTTPTLTGTAAIGEGQALTVTVNGVTYSTTSGLTLGNNNSWSLAIPEANKLTLGQSYEVRADLVPAAVASARSVAGTATADALTNTVGTPAVFNGAAGNDSVTGGSRADMVAFAGRFSEYTITTSAGVVTVTDRFPAGTTRSVSDGVDTLRGVNLLRFADRDFFVTTAANKGTLPGGDQTYRVNNSEWVLGNTTAVETFVVAPQTSSLIAVGTNDVVDLSRSINSYTYKAVLNQLQISDGTYTTFLNIGGKITLRTASGATSVSYNGNIVLGDTANGTSQIVGAAGFDASRAIIDVNNKSSNALLSLTDLSSNELVLTDTIPPAFLSARTDSTGTKLVLTYSEPLAAATGAASAFAVMVNDIPRTVSTVAVVGSTVELTLLSAITSGQIVTVAYMDPTAANDAYAVQDAAGNDAMGLGSTVVTNRVGYHLTGTAADLAKEAVMPTLTGTIGDITVLGGADASEAAAIDGIGAVGTISFESITDEAARIAALSFESEVAVGHITVLGGADASEAAAIDGIGAVGTISFESITDDAARIAALSFESEVAVGHITVLGGADASEAAAIDGIGAVGTISFESITDDAARIAALSFESEVAVGHITVLGVADASAAVAIDGIGAVGTISFESITDDAARIAALSFESEVAVGHITVLGVADASAAVAIDGIGAVGAISFVRITDYGARIAALSFESEVAVGHITVLGVADASQAVAIDGIGAVGTISFESITDDAARIAELSFESEVAVGHITAKTAATLEEAAAIDGLGATDPVSYDLTGTAEDLAKEAVMPTLKGTIGDITVLGDADASDLLAIRLATSGMIIAPDVTALSGTVTQIQTITDKLGTGSDKFSIGMMTGGVTNVDLFVSDTLVTAANLLALDAKTKGKVYVEWGATVTGAEIDVTKMVAAGGIVLPFEFNVTVTGVGSAVPPSLLPSLLSSIGDKTTGVMRVQGTTGNNTLKFSATTHGLTIDGDAGNDVITGTAYNDIISGGAGNDTLTGGEGADTYVFGSTGADNGSDTIEFIVDDGDVLNFNNFLPEGSAEFSLYIAKDNNDFNIANKLVLFDAEGASLDIEQLVAKIQGGGNAFALDGKAIVLAVNTTTLANQMLIYFVNSALDGISGDVTKNDIQLVGTTSTNFDLDSPLTEFNVTFIA